MNGNSNEFDEAPQTPPPPPLFMIHAQTQTRPSPGPATGVNSTLSASPHPHSRFTVNSYDGPFSGLPLEWDFQPPHSHRQPQQLLPTVMTDEVTDPAHV
ncbi:hypothetical protein E4U59_007023 [Claviceps monticola]|nr:hypothetical protein E4U59_007023 [Claviceps monticola]